MYVGEEEIPKYMQYEIYMTVYMGRLANQRKVPKWLPFENNMSESQNIDVHIPGTYRRIHIKHEVFIWLCTDNANDDTNDDDNDDDNARRTKHDCTRLFG